MANSMYDFGSLAPLRQAAQGDKIELAARFGYLAKGLVFGTVGVLTVMAAFGYASGELTGTRGALEAFNEQSWGPFALALLAAGLAGFALWRGVQAFRDTEDKGDDASALAQRAGFFGSGVVYASLAVYATKLLFDMSSSGSSPEQRAAEVMANAGGTLVIGGLGLILFGVGLYQMYRVVTAKFKRNWQTGEMSARQEKLATLISRIGISARAVAFLMIGSFLGWAAVTGQPQKAQGMEGALTTVAENTNGQLLVGIAGAGLVCYGIYCLINAMFRQIDTQGD